MTEDMYWYQCIKSGSKTGTDVGYGCKSSCSKINKTVHCNVLFVRNIDKHVIQKKEVYEHHFTYIPGSMKV